MNAAAHPDNPSPSAAFKHPSGRAANTLPPGLVSLLDHEQHAQRLLPAAVWAYFQGGAADEITLRANVQAWQRLPLLPRVLRPLAGGHTRVALLGRTLAHPMLVAPMAHQALAHPHGELATALAAAALGAGLVLSTQASTPLEDVAHTYLPDADRGPLWFQLYLQADRGFTRELVQRAAAAGFEALVLTVDAPVQGLRERERRAGFVLPAGVSAVNLAGMQPASPTPLQPGQSALIDGLLRLVRDHADEAAGALAFDRELRELEAAVDAALAVLEPYGAVPLTVYDGAAGNCSEPVEFLSSLYNGELRAVALPRADLGRHIPYKRVTFGDEAFELRGPTAADTKVGAILSVKDYPSETQAGLLDGLL
ncbi:MAG: alpha-hydroxy-acid oxidizing protein, partial [Hydrogenophaga sp.]|nr:alpha-hydroxy-acid oxidizing protein [Hydrogenophaga sp.]